MTDESPADDRRTARQSLIPAIYRTNNERLACELACKMEPSEEIFARYGFDAASALALMDQPEFSALLARVGAEVAENGLSFRTKIRSIAEDLLPEAFDIATDPQQSAAVRADIIKWAGKMAGYEPSVKDDAKTGGGLSLSITFAGQPPQTVVTSREPVTIEQEV